jgi:DNA-binding MarR family transcriptional regulator
MNGKVCGASDIQYESGSFPEVFQLIDTVAKKLTQLQRQRIREADLTPPQYSILSLLWDTDGRRLKELASACCCSPSTITGVIDTMEKKGFVARELNPDDRRSLLVKLTEKGEALKDAAPSLEKVFRNCCVGIQPDELQQLSKLLRKLDGTLTY